VVSFTVRPLLTKEKGPGTHWIGDRVGPRAGLDAVANRKKSHHCRFRELNPGRPARSLVTTLTDLSYSLRKESRVKINFYITMITVLGAGIAQWYSAGLRAG
jgi:hypothetical protein